MKRKKGMNIFGFPVELILSLVFIIIIFIFLTGVHKKVVEYLFG